MDVSEVDVDPRRGKLFFRAFLGIKMSPNVTVFIHQEFCKLFNSLFQLKIIQSGKFLYLRYLLVMSKGAISQARKKALPRKKSNLTIH